MFSGNGAMLTKSAVLLLTLVLLTPSLANAAPPQPRARYGAPPPAVQGVQLPGYEPAKPDSPQSAEVLKSAKALKESMNPAQQKAVDAILKKYSGQFDAIAKSLPPLAKLSYAPVGEKPASVSYDQVAELLRDAPLLVEAIAKSEAVQAKIEAELKTVLSPDQWAKYTSLLGPQRSRLATAKVKAQSLLNAPANPDVSTYWAYYAGGIGSFADYFAYATYYYAYMNYYYNYYGSYSAYYYLYYTHEYTMIGLPYAGGGYFDAAIFAADRNNFLYSAVTPFGYATNYAYYGFNYAYNNYYYYGYNYAYYAYYWGTYANYYSYYAYLYSYYAY